jgi:hypothetical protein
MAKAGGSLQMIIPVVTEPARRGLAITRASG